MYNPDPLFILTDIPKKFSLQNVCLLEQDKIVYRPVDPESCFPLDMAFKQRYGISWFHCSEYLCYKSMVRGPIGGGPYAFYLAVMENHQCWWHQIIDNFSTISLYNSGVYVQCSSVKCYSKFGYFFLKWLICIKYYRYGNKVIKTYIVLMCLCTWYARGHVSVRSWLITVSFCPPSWKNTDNFI